MKTYRHPAAAAPGARACLRACPTPSLAVLLPLAAALGLAALSASPTTARAQTAPAVNAPSAPSRAYAIGFSRTYAKAVGLDDAAITDAVRAAHGALVVTADHGNLEMMRDPATGQPHTAHTVGPVPLVYVGERAASLRSGGALRDIAPTLLDLLDLPKPTDMSGHSLLLPA